MRDILSLIDWYLHPRSRISRGMFNLVVFFSFIPVLWLQLTSGVNSVSEKAYGVAPVIQSIVQQTQSAPENVEEFLMRAEQTRMAAEGVMETFSSSSESENTSPAQTVNLIIYAALFPIVLMRLRDAGVYAPFAVWGLGLLSYSGVLLDAGKMTGLLTVPMPLYIAAQVLSFFFMLWLCTKPSAERTVRRTNFMPGDSENDPY